MAALNAGMTSAGGAINEEPGYAKLQGENFDYFIQDQSIILGRNSKKEKVDIDMFELGGGMYISRRHARIFYDFQCRQFALEVLSSNGCMVQGVLYFPGDGPVKLNSQDILQIGQIKFCFLLPIRSIEVTAAARHTHIPSQPLSSSLMRSAHPPSLDVRDCGNDYGRDNGDNGIRVGTEVQGKSRKQSKGNDYGRDKGDNGIRVGTEVQRKSRKQRKGNDYGRGNGISVGTEVQGKSRKQRKRSSGELDIYSGYPIIVEPVGALGERANKLQIRRADKDTNNKQLVLKEEKYFISHVTTLVSDSCGPGEWVPVAKLHSELIKHFSKIQSQSEVQKYLKPEGDLSIETEGRPWFKLLELLKEYPEHFVINAIIRGKVTAEFVSLVALHPQLL